MDDESEFLIPQYALSSLVEEVSDIGVCERYVDDKSFWVSEITVELLFVFGSGSS